LVVVYKKTDLHDPLIFLNQSYTAVSFPLWCSAATFLD
jgi:hypothetical protein